MGGHIQLVTSDGGLASGLIEVQFSLDEPTELTLHVDLRNTANFSLTGPSNERTVTTVSDQIWRNLIYSAGTYQLSLSHDITGAANPTFILRHVSRKLHVRLRPVIIMPRRSALSAELHPEAVTAVIDTREHQQLTLAPLRTVRGTLATGDYSVNGLEAVVAAERKSLSDLITCVGVAAMRQSRRRGLKETK